MKATLLNTLLLLLMYFSNTYLLYAQNDPLLSKSIQIKKQSGFIKDYLKLLRQNYSIKFSYDDDVIPQKHVKIKPGKWSLHHLLTKLFRGTTLDHQSVYGQIVLKRNTHTKVTLSGTIKNKNDGEHLIGATIYIKELGVGTTSNTYGYYSLTVPIGKYTVLYSYIGYHTMVKKLNMKESTLLDINLASSIDALDEVVIRAPDEDEIGNFKNIQMSAHKMDMERINSIPMLAGETDVLKSIQHLPGIQTANTGTVGFSVRGGSYDQNLILLDEAPVYNISHAMGIFSIFNTDAIKDINVYKGNIPARYGGRLSSVVDIRMKEGNSQRFSLNGGIGLTSSRLTLEGPIGKQVSYIVSGRYGYLGYTANQLASHFSSLNPQIQSFGKNNEISFYDLNAKINVKLNKNNKVYFSTYTGNDHFFNDVVFENNTLDWGNQTATFRWNHIFSPRLFSNLTLIYSNFDYAYVINNDVRNFKWSANFKQVGAKLDFDYFITPKNTLTFGVSVTRHQFSPGIITPINDSSVVRPFTLDTKQAVESGIYLSQHLKIGSKLSLKYGLRFSAFYNIGEGIKYTFDQEFNLLAQNNFSKGEIMHQNFGLAPRVGMKYQLDSYSSIKASYSRTYQYLHLVSNSSVGLPTDVWLPVDNNVKPRIADQVALGYFRSFKNGQYGLSAEIYHKWISQVIDYKDNADIFLNQNIETQIRSGVGQAYGIELLFEKKKGKLTGWISYTLSKVQRNIQEVNNNQTYSPRHDRRHNASLVASYKLSKRWQLSFNYSYMTGIGITVPQGIFVSNGKPYNYYSPRNSFKLPDFHQLDIGIKLKSNQKRRWRGEWTFGVTNAYNRENALTLYIQHQENAKTNIYKMFLFGLMPSINYNFKF